MGVSSSRLPVVGITTNEHGRGHSEGSNKAASVSSEVETRTSKAVETQEGLLVMEEDELGFV
jgi:hypothetical protein